MDGFISNCFKKIPDGQDMRTVGMAVTCVAGVSKNLREENETGRESKKKGAEGGGEASEGNAILLSPPPSTSRLPPSQFSPIFCSPHRRVSLAFSISAWKRKGNGCYAD